MKTQGSGPVICNPPLEEDCQCAIATFSHCDCAPNTDPDSSFWSDAAPVFASRDTHGEVVAGHRTEIRARWSTDNLYFLFVCPYQELNLKPCAETAVETNGLWNWDVAEVFVGSDLGNIRRYKEFEVSPQGEWVDLDIDLDRENKEDGWVWKSGCEVTARVDAPRKVWFGFMRIPYSAVDDRPAAFGNRLRINFYRSQGPEPNCKEIAWRPTHSATFHVPESFGTLLLVNVRRENETACLKES